MDSQSWRSAEIAYEAIAPVYDEFTHHHDYELWLGNLLPELKRQGLRGDRLLDVACGTGKSFLPMLERGWRVVACDISAAMVERARAKIGDRVQLSVQDMRKLPVLGEFDLIWCLDDAVNYLLSREELEAALRGMRANLDPESGLLMFDVNSISSYRGFFAEEVVVEREGWRLLWKGLTPTEAAPGSIAEAAFEAIPIDGEEGTISREVHRQRHFPEAEMLAALEASGLECLDVIGHDLEATLGRPFDEEAHSKVVYISRVKR